MTNPRHRRVRMTRVATGVYQVGEYRLVHDGDAWIVTAPLLPPFLAGVRFSTRGSAYLAVRRVA